MCEYIQPDHPDWLKSIALDSDLKIALEVKKDNIFHQQLIASIASGMAQFIDQDTASSLAEMQYRARIANYTSSFPNSRCCTICYLNKKIGQLWVWLTETDLYLLDIIILESARNQGLGTECIRGLIDYSNSTDRIFKLEVESGNIRAQNLYIRLGLQRTSQSDTHIQMTISATNKNII